MRPKRTDVSDEMARAIGQRVRDAREAKGLSLRNVGAVVGVSPTTILNFERGNIGVLGAEKTAALARAVGLDPDTIVTSVGRVPEDVAVYLLETPGVIDVLRKAKRAGLTSEDMMRAMGWEESR